MVKCELCNKEFKNAQGLAGHMRLVHKTMQKITNESPMKTEKTEQTEKKEQTEKTEQTEAKPPPKEEEKAIPEDFERELWLQATPLIRKVVLNPEIFFWYDYAKGKLNLKGDVGDFVCDCVKYFFKSHGYKIQIIKEEEI